MIRVPRPDQLAPVADPPGGLAEARVALHRLAAYVIGAPTFNNRIEADLEQRVPAELSDAGFDGITAEFKVVDPEVPKAPEQWETAR